jgi:NAD(P)-dependent dehydrogenase (short-subunit alcohol dehydrogenase family)
MKNSLFNYGTIIPKYLLLWNKYSKMKKLENKTAVVTGGSSGIGLATAKELIEQGAKIIITGRNKEGVQASAKKLGAKGLVSDQSSLADIDALVAETKKQFGHVDILFVNAGIAAFAPVEAVTEKLYDDMMNINFKGALFTLQKFLPLLKQGSSVTFLSSINAYTGMPSTAVYAASKAALNSLMRTAAYELAPKGIRVNAVCPGPINTPLFGKVGLSEEAVQQFAGAMQQRIPLKRFGAFEDVAKLVSFLSSDDASFITGSEYVIDGGVILNPLLG